MIIANNSKNRLVAASHQNLGTSLGVEKFEWAHPPSIAKSIAVKTGEGSSLSNSNSLNSPKRFHDQGKNAIILGANAQKKLQEKPGTAGVASNKVLDQPKLSPRVNKGNHTKASADKRKGGPPQKIFINAAVFDTHESLDKFSNVEGSKTSGDFQQEAANSFKMIPNSSQPGSLKTVSRKESDLDKSVEDECKFVRKYSSQTSGKPMGGSPGVPHNPSGSGMSRSTDFKTELISLLSSSENLQGKNVKYIGKNSNVSKHKLTINSGNDPLEIAEDEEEFSLNQQNIQMPTNNLGNTKNAKALLKITGNLPMEVLTPRTAGLSYNPAKEEENKEMTSHTQEDLQEVNVKTPRSVTNLINTIANQNNQNEPGLNKDASNNIISKRGANSGNDRFKDIQKIYCEKHSDKKAPAPNLSLKRPGFSNASTQNISSSALYLTLPSFSNINVLNSTISAKGSSGNSSSKGKGGNVSAYKEQANNSSSSQIYASIENFKLRNNIGLIQKSNGSQNALLQKEFIKFLSIKNSGNYNDILKHKNSAPATHLAEKHKYQHVAEENNFQSKPYNDENEKEKHGFLNSDLIKEKLDGVRAFSLPNNALSFRSHNQTSENQHSYPNNSDGANRSPGSNREEKKTEEKSFKAEQLVALLVRSKKVIADFKLKELGWNKKKKEMEEEILYLRSELSKRG